MLVVAERQRQKMEIIFKCLVFFVGLTLAASYDVNKADIHTSDCEDCGMSAFGRLSLKVLSGHSFLCLSCMMACIQ